MGLDILWGYDRRPVSMAVLRAKTGRSWPFLSGCQDGGAQDYHLPTDNSHTTFFFFITTLTYRQKDRQTHSTRNTYDMGSFMVRGGGGMATPISF